MLIILTEIDAAMTIRDAPHVSIVGTYDPPDLAPFRYRLTWWRSDPRHSLAQFAKRRDIWQQLERPSGGAVSRDIAHEHVALESC